MPAGKVNVGKVRDIPVGTMVSSHIGEEEILVANVEGKFYAMRSTCNHMGGPLNKGELDGNILTCPWHGAKWDVTTGKLISFYTPLPPEPVYKTMIEGEDLFVENF